MLKMPALKGNGSCGHSKQAAICKPRREASEETNPAPRRNLDLGLLASRTIKIWISVV